MWNSGWIAVISSNDICLKRHHLWSDRYVSSHIAVWRFLILCGDDEKCEKMRPSALKSDVAPRCTSRAFANYEFLLDGGGFFIRVYTKNRWNTCVEIKAEIESRFQMINNKSSRQVYMQFSISIGSSWACPSSWQSAHWKCAGIACQLLPLKARDLTKDVGNV